MKYTQCSTLLNFIITCIENLFSFLPIDTLKIQTPFYLTPKPQESNTKIRLEMHSLAKSQG